MSNNKSEQARLNGAKSRGAKTPEGKARSRAANTRHGLYAAHGALLAHENRQVYEALRQQTIAQLSPGNAYELLLVEEVVDCTWLISRLRFCCTTDVNKRLSRIRSTSSVPLLAHEATADAEIESSGARSGLQLLESRIRALTANRSRILADLRLCRQNAPTTGSTQDLLKTEHLDFPINPPVNPSGTQLNPTQEQNR
ncbi:MAG: hypothetical protein ACKV2U_05690 [Bryobacteraceae bacterium]